MFFANQKPTLTIRGGGKKSRRVALRQTDIVIGAGRRCQVVVKGDDVAEYHARLKARDGDQWELQNLSEFGTCVNRIPVNRKILRPGDIITVGADTLLEFQQPVTEPAPGRQPKADTAPAKPWLNRKALAAVGVWYVLMAVLFIALSRIDLAPPLASLSAAEVKLMLSDTRDWLDHKAPRSAIDAAGCRTLDPRSDPAYAFYTMLCEPRPTASASATSIDSSLRKDALLTELERVFYHAWHKEMQQQWRAALDNYRHAIALLPDLRAPSTRLANARVLALNERLQP